MDPSGKTTARSTAALYYSDRFKKCVNYNLREWIESVKHFVYTN